MFQECCARWENDRIWIRLLGEDRVRHGWSAGRRRGCSGEGPPANCRFRGRGAGSPRECLSDHLIVGVVVRNGEISDAAWAVIEALLPPVGRARGRWRDHRQVMEGIVFKFRTSAP